MPRRKKPFIDKKKATKYRLIPGFVPDRIDEDEVLQTEEDVDKRKGEQRQYGIFFEDNYNYMQHLRSLTEGATMIKDSDFNNIDDEMRSSYGGSVNFRMFSSEVETKEEWIDPDILASFDEAPVVKVNEEGEMECDDNATDFLEDDFINQAGGYEPKPEKEEDPYEGHDRELDFEDEDFPSDFDDDSQEENSEDEETNVHLYSGRGNVQDDIIEAQTALILKNFEEGLGFSCEAQQLDDDDGVATTEDYEQLKQILISDKLKETKMMTANEFLDDHKNRPEFNYSKFANENDNAEEEFEWKDVPPSKPKFDCVSILSLNSNTRNLPTDIIPPGSEKKRSKKSSTSETEPSQAPGLSRQELEEEIRLSRRADKASTFRPQDETPEERKNRKKAIKDERKERRQEKKANQIVFSMEKQKMDREVAALSKTGHGIKLS